MFEEESSSCSDSDQDNKVSQTQKTSIKSKPSKHKIQLLKDALGISSEDLEKHRAEKQSLAALAKNNSKRVSTMASRKSTKQRPEVEVVVFEDPAKRKADTQPGPSTKKTSRLSHVSDDTKFDLSSARFEIRKFGISGLEGQSKESGMTDLMVSLGAKPPKRDYINYKQYQEQVKAENIKAAEERELNRKMGLKVAKSAKHRSKKDRNDVGIADGQLGDYRHGVQIIRKQHMERVNLNKPKKR